MIVFSKGDGRESYVYYTCDMTVHTLTCLMNNMEKAGYEADTTRMYR